MKYRSLKDKYKKPKKPKKIKDKDVAWTPEKTTMLKSLFVERIIVENNRELAEEWGITESWFVLLFSVLTDVQKQTILNYLIDAKVEWLTSMVDENVTETAQWNTDIASLNGLKV